MRILIVSHLYPPYIAGGAEKSVSLLAEALARSGDEVSVVSFHPRRDEAIEELNGVRVYRLPLGYSYWPFIREQRGHLLCRVGWRLADLWNWRAARRFSRILDLESPDVVHTNVLMGFSVAIWRAVKKKNIRLVHTLRDYYMICPFLMLNRASMVCDRRCLICKVLTVGHRIESRYVDRVVSISEYVLKAHRKSNYFACAPGSVIYNSYDPAYAVGGAPDKKSDELIFGFAGSLNPPKGIETLLKATTLMSNSNWKLRIAGRGYEEYVASLQNRFPDPRIEWLGFVDARAFYGTIDVSVIPSIWPEPLSRIVIETFAAGKSAICAASGGIPEVASRGRTVELYAAEDAAALAKIMDEAVEHISRWRTGGFIDADSVRMFSPQYMAEQYRRIYASPSDGGARMLTQEACRESSTLQRWISP